MTRVKAAAVDPRRKTLRVLLMTRVKGALYEGRVLASLLEPAPHASHRVFLTTLGVPLPAFVPPPLTRKQGTGLFPGACQEHTAPMEDLRIEAGPGCPKGLVVPAGELVERFSHSSGPGGQGVNTSDSRVQLSFDVTTTSALNERQRERALTALAGRLVDGVLTITASEQRSQFANRKAARQRLAALLRSSLAPLPQRRASKPTRASKLQRLRDKRIRSELKAQRRRPLAD